MPENQGKSKARQPWFKCFTVDYLEATRGLCPEERGVYFDCLCLIYQFEQPLPKDDKWMSHQLHISPRLWRSIRDRLLEAGKLTETDDGYVNARAQLELESRAVQARTNAETAVKRERAKREISKNPNENNKTDARKEHHAYARQIPESDTDKIIPPLPPKGGPTPTEALKAFEAYNATALRCGIPQASKLTPARQKKILARLREYGLDGWERALGNIEKSSFLTGGTDKGFRADLDFVCQAKSFGKLHDGGYGNGRHVTPANAKPYEQPAWVRETLEMMNS